MDNFRAGSNLRGALGAAMTRTYCAGDVRDPSHAAICPVHWLLAANEKPGQERRGYALVPPLVESAAGLKSQESFEFGLTLFGSALQFLPYFVLAVLEMGQLGVGVGRGRFTLKSIHAEHPISGDWEVLKEGENLVKPPAEMVTQAAIEQSAEAFASRLGTGQPRLRIDFLTPLRLILGERLVKSPDFGVIFSHILKRLDDLAIQYAGGTVRPAEERQHLWNLANRVHLVESQVNWADVPSGSSRTGQPTWISGLVGTAWYSAPEEVWRELLPWLLWGEITQVGKDTAKGNGVFRIKADRG